MKERSPGMRFGRPRCVTCLGPRVVVVAGYGRTAETRIRGLSQTRHSSLVFPSVKGMGGRKVSDAERRVKCAQPFPAFLACLMAVLSYLGNPLEVFMFLAWFYTNVSARFNCLIWGLVGCSY